MKLRFLEAAKQEIDDAANYYDGCREGLNNRFRRELESCLSNISEAPSRYALRTGDDHRANLKSFPYYVAYIVHAGTVWVLAIAHVKRLPLYWISRLDNLD